MGLTCIGDGCMEALLCFSCKCAYTGAWKTLAELEEQELRKLAASLPATVLHTHADSTTSNYMCAFKHWKVWAELHLEVAVYPGSDVHLILYLLHLGEAT